MSALDAQPRKCNASWIWNIPGTIYWDVFQCLEHRLSGASEPPKVPSSKGAFSASIPRGFDSSCEMGPKNWHFNRSLVSCLGPCLENPWSTMTITKVYTVTTSPHQLVGLTLLSKDHTGVTHPPLVHVNHLTVKLLLDSPQCDKGRRCQHSLISPVCLLINKHYTNENMSILGH